MTGGRQRGSRTAAILIVAVVAFLAGASPASAHSSLERSDPPNGGMVPAGRPTLTLWFSEPIIGEASTFDLHTPDGVQVADTASVSEADGQGIVGIEVAPLAETTYRLDWSVLSADDGHPSSGTVEFGVGTRPVVEATGGGGLPSGRNLLLRWLDLSAIMLVIGSLAVSGRVLGSIGPAGETPRRRARHFGAMAAGAAVVLGVITPFVRMPHGGSSLGDWFEATWATLAGTAWGHVWLAREIALVIAAAALWSLAARSDGSRRRIQVAVVAMAAAVWFEALVGHASDLPRQSGVAALASAVHLVAAGVWAGGLTLLVVCLVPAMRRDPDARGPMVASAWRAFSPMAAVATVVLVATGLYESGRHLPDLHSITSTVYGGAVLGKLILVAVALILAGFNTLLVNPGLAEPVARALNRPVGWAPVSLRRFTTVVSVEVVILIVAGMGAALLTSVPTARETASAAQETAPHSANVDGLFVTFEQVPAGGELSRFIVRARSTVKPEPGPIVGVQVLLVGPSGTTELSLSLDPVEPGRYEAETATLAPGDWQASVAVQREGLPDAVTLAAWTVEDAAADPVGPLELAATALALLLLAALAGVITLVRRARKRPNDWMPLDDEAPVRQP
jgi:copper transport protein